MLESVPDCTPSIHGDESDVKINVIVTTLSCVVLLIFHVFINLALVFRLQNETFVL